MSRQPVYTYRNKHTGTVVRIVGSPMRADGLYAATSPWLDEEPPDTYRLVFGLPGRDGTAFEPQHWERVA